MKNSFDVTMRNEEATNKLAEICEIICSNYKVLQTEFSEISNILNMAESYTIAYSEIEFIKMHLNAQKETLNFLVFEEILKRLEKVKVEVKQEFVRNIDFCQIVQQILSQKNRSDMVVFVWEAKKILKYIIYEFDRIKNTDDENKKVAILKGMIAYY